jgi:hypothetical protein
MAQEYGGYPYEQSDFCALSKLHEGGQFTTSREKLSGSVSPSVLRSSTVEY